MIPPPLKVHRPFLYASDVRVLLLIVLTSIPVHALLMMPFLGRFTPSSVPFRAT